MSPPSSAASGDAPPPAPRDGSGVRSDLELARARRIAWVLDDLVPIPGTRWRVGVDPFLGLVPGVGDWVGWVVSLHLLVAGARAGADGATLVRMAGNLLLDALVGALPLLGDAFDVAWKANDRNLRLLERVVANRDATRAASRWLVGGVVGGTVALLGAASLGALLLLRRVVEAVATVF